MPAPRDLIESPEQDIALPGGNDERFAGYGVMGLPFASGHILGLRRFPASSLGPGYTSVWHRDPEGRWTFYSDVPPEQSCARYFGSAVAEAPLKDIQITWTGLRGFSVEIDAGHELTWEATLVATPATRMMNAMASMIPDALWRQAVVLRMMVVVAGLVLRAGHMALAGQVPNGQRFMANPRLMWAIPSSRAVVRGQDLGDVGPVPVQARLGDFWIPQRGIFVIGRAFFEPFDPARHLSTTCQTSDN